MDLQTLDLVDNDGREVNVYGQDGRRVARRSASFVDPEALPFAVLFDLNQIGNIMDTAVDHLHRYDEDTVLYEDLTRPSSDAPLHVYPYPQAFLHSVGHFQANRLPPPFQVIFERIQSKVARRTRADSSNDNSDTSDEEDEEDENDRYAISVLPVARGFSCQGYNELSHRTRPTASQHEVQQGQVTSALSGAYSLNAVTKRTHRTKIESCDTSLPQERFEDKIEVSPRDGRVELVAGINMQAMKASMRNGG